MLQGLGCDIWLLSELPPPATLADFCSYYNIRWIAFKMLDGKDSFNWSTGNISKIVEYLAALTAKGIQCGAWQYNEGWYPGPEGAAVGAMFEKFEQHGLSFFFVDAEAGNWNKFGSKGRMELYLNSLGLPSRIPVYLHSYRFPSLFPKFPFAAALRHDRVSGAAPQVYWEGSHNPEEQVIRSWSEYEEVAGRGIIQEFIPVAPTYWRGTPGAAGSWGPTAADLRAFHQICVNTGLKAWGFYRLEKVLQHFRATAYVSGAEWMTALTDKAPYQFPDTPPAPPPTPQPTYRVMEVLATRLDILRSPEPDAKVGGHITKGVRPFVYGSLTQAADKSIWARVGQSQMFAMVQDRKGNRLMRWV